MLWDDHRGIKIASKNDDIEPFIGIDGSTSPTRLDYVVAFGSLNWLAIWFLSCWLLRDNITTSSLSNTIVKLPRFCGHRNICVSGVHNGQEECSLYP